MKVIGLKFFSEEDLEHLITSIWVRLEETHHPSPTHIWLIEPDRGDPLLQLSFEYPAAADVILATFAERHPRPFIGRCGGATRKFRRQARSSGLHA